MKAYFISGIGADHRFFKHIRLPAGFEPVYLDYFPHSKEETLTAYAQRMGKLIDNTEGFVLIGFSLGGIMATEIAKQLRPAATILISSIPLSSQLPTYYRAARFLRLHTLFPGVFFKFTASLKHLLSTEESWQDKKWVFRIIRDGDPRFIRWAINAVLNWDNQVRPPNLHHIHGTRDEVFPIRYTQPMYVLRKAGHTTVISHPKKINGLLEKILVR